MKKPNYLLRIVIILLVLLSVWSYVLVRTATSFGYSKGFEKGVASGALMQQLQDSLDRENERDSMYMVIDSIERRIVHVPFKRDTIVITKP